MSDPSSSLAADEPTWQPDSSSLECSLCGSKFGLFNRRHHCRKCGKLICGSCSSQFIAFFPNSRIVRPLGPLRRTIVEEYHRMCDECADETRMIRQALEDRGTPERGPPTPTTRAAAIAKRVVQVATRPLDLASTLLVDADSSSDHNLCPICAKNLEALYEEQVSRDDLEDSNEAREAFKERHVSECLVESDFALELRLVAGSPLRNRMLVYKVPPIQPGESPGNDQDHECVICLEDICPGDKVGRLECLCVFHYKCIKDWFNRKGPGLCPVHFLHK